MFMFKAREDIGLLEGIYQPFADKLLRDGNCSSIQDTAPCSKAHDVSFLLQWCCCSFDPIFCKRRTRWRHGWKYDASPDSLALQLSLFTRCRTHLTSTDLVVLSTSRMWVCGGLAVGRRWRMVVLQLRHCNWGGVRGWTKTEGCMLEADGDTHKILVKGLCYCTLYIYIYL